MLYAHKGSISRCRKVYKGLIVCYSMETEELNRELSDFRQFVEDEFKKIYDKLDDILANVVKQ